jgi:Galactosyltransferase
MSNTRVDSGWTETPRPWGRPGGSLLACIYTCEAHRPLLERFHASEVGRLLHETPGVRIVEVYADAAAERSYLDGDSLLLRANELYSELSIKTHRMIEFCAGSFNFDNLLKIDITTVLTQAELSSPEYSERQAMDMAAIADFLGKADYSRDYLGFLLHAQAGREGAENWARKKGKAIDYARLFGDGPMPPFYSGKCYVISRRFAEFIARFGAEVAEQQHRFLIGSEDVMIGRLYDRFLSIGTP